MQVEFERIDVGRLDGRGAGREAGFLWLAGGLSGRREGSPALCGYNAGSRKAAAFPTSGCWKIGRLRLRRLSGGGGQGLVPSARLGDKAGLSRYGHRWEPTAEAFRRWPVDDPQGTGSGTQREERFPPLGLLKPRYTCWGGWGLPKPEDRCKAVWYAKSSNRHVSQARVHHRP